MAGAGAGALAGLAACATLACNVAGAVLFLLSQDDERLRRGCAARLGAGGVASQPVEECGDEEALAPDAVLNLELGDPTMYRAFWREVGDCGATVIRGCQGMSYFSDDDAVLCWFLEPELEREVRRLHRIVGNAVVDGYHLVVGTGATQLYQAAMYALSSPARRDQPVPVVSPAPYYSSYPPQTDLLLSDFYRWAGDANTFTVAATGAFSLPEETSGYCNFAKQTVTACPAFAWLRCEKEGVEDCAELLAGHKIVGSGGEQFGGDARCVRINMLDRDNVFNMLVQRLSSIN
ncbi:Alliin lyase [Zea mays]|uniref:Alliin lyase n=1 Tax=Zea mays TaxID=4577 RepID=A0A1D6LZP4_MAIZE|nr:Alliin lyase [Zea mays]